MAWIKSMKRLLRRARASTNSGAKRPGERPAMLATWTLKSDPWAAAIGAPGEINGPRPARPGVGALTRKEKP
jgi:hypothetical protein